MVLMPKPVTSAIRSVKSEKAHVVYLSPQGTPLTAAVAKRLAQKEHLILLAGHYEGIDERVSGLVTDEISIGDYILTGGEIPAMAVLDTVTRLIPGVLGDNGSLDFESFENNLLEYPQYTRPREFKRLKVPEVLLSGNHDKIARWRKNEAEKMTRSRRKDLVT